jgi:hypothetical protein
MSIVKIDFNLDTDESNYPPIKVETLNGILLADGAIQIDNAPFFVEEIAVGDKVKCSSSQDRVNYQFEEVVEEGDHKAISIIFIDDSCKETIYQYLKSLNCFCEYGEFQDFNMLAIDIDSEVDYLSVKKYLSEKESEGIISYAELCI